MEKLPHCVLSNIFIGFRAKHLAQMRTVSKSWNALLSHSSFIKYHLDHSVDSNNEILLIFKKPFSFDSKPFTVHLSRSPNLDLANFIKLPLNPQSKNRSGSVVGSDVIKLPLNPQSNGLICFEYGSYEYSDVIYIWNPSLSALLTLPPYSMPSECNAWICTYFGFGFDPTTDDYKVVKVLGIIGSKVDTTEWMQVEVYSMRKGTWEFITQKIPSHLTNIYDQDVVCQNGAETFREIHLPDSVLDYTVYKISNLLGVFTGKLCVMSSFQASGSTKFELWVMDEYGVAESWVKLHVFSPCELNPRGIISHNEFLFQDLRGDLALYDPIATKFFKFQGECKWIHKVVRYVDSLVWVSPASCCSISQFQF
ncbi:unnamed protein product [Lactuca virosa]|uniref:F-box domain-containing protein n=1 Tax=Lactuca virosa TaxID=75947 RepID=A0AAU9PE25_9ASTR|nr:unnamed protein product [Lactuca virosa]